MLSKNFTHGFGEVSVVEWWETNWKVLWGWMDLFELEHGFELARYDGLMWFFYVVVHSP